MKRKAVYQPSLFDDTPVTVQGEAVLSSCGPVSEVIAEPAPVPVVATPGEVMEKSVAVVTFHKCPCKLCGHVTPGFTSIIREYWLLPDGSRVVRWQCMKCWWAARNAVYVEASA